jgi:hypothetical protein
LNQQYTEIPEEEDDGSDVDDGGEGGAEEDDYEAVAENERDEVVSANLDKRYAWKQSGMARSTYFAKMAEKRHQAAADMKSSQPSLTAYGFTVMEEPNDEADYSSDAEAELFQPGNLSDGGANVPLMRDT